MSCVERFMSNVKRWRSTVERWTSNVESSKFNVESFSFSFFVKFLTPAGHDASRPNTTMEPVNHPVVDRHSTPTIHIQVNPFYLKVINTIITKSKDSKRWKTKTNIAPFDGTWNIFASWQNTYHMHITSNTTSNTAQHKYSTIKLQTML